MARERGEKVIAVNRKARHDYFVEDSYEAGLALHGTEVKSIRLGHVNLKESYCAVKDREMFAFGMHISPYEKGNIYNRDPMRPKKLLLHRAQIAKLGSLVQRQGYALVPLKVYLKDGRMKMELGLCKGKKVYDKRDDAAERSARRDMERAMKQ
ncbi:MAG: SsrA-binding protein SmpB [Firmicutes bacterium]|nr:SsrA-binding protein SmpB [Bacillota bacterium]